MAQTDEGYMLTELWNAKPSWLALSEEERRAFFEKKMHPFVASLVGQGAEPSAAPSTTIQAPSASVIATWQYGSCRTRRFLRQTRPRQVRKN